MKWYKLLAKAIEAKGGRRDIYRMVSGVRVLYLTRYYIFKSPNFEIMLHNFHIGDLPVFHDHPWDNYNIILETGYYEHTLEGKFFREPGYKGYRGAKDLHYVELLPHTEGKVWTVFATLKRERRWGFYLPEAGWIDFEEYQKREGTWEANSLPEKYSDGLFPTRIAN